MVVLRVCRVVLAPTLNNADEKVPEEKYRSSDNDRRRADVSVMEVESTPALNNADVKCQE